MTHSFTWTRRRPLPPTRATSRRTFRSPLIRSLLCSYIIIAVVEGNARGRRFPKYFGKKRNTKLHVTRCSFRGSKCTKIRLRTGISPVSLWEAYRALSISLAELKGVYFYITAAVFNFFSKFVLQRLQVYV